MKGRLRVFGGLVAVLAVVAAFSAPSASANGCTPGFWKNRAVKLDLYNSSATVSTVFVTADFGSWTLLQALQGGGGDTLVDKKRILLRAAVAGWLNYGIGGFNALIPFGLFGSDGHQPTVGEYVGVINLALASSDAAAIEELASWIDFKNNEGSPAICA